MNISKIKAATLISEVLAELKSDADTKRHIESKFAAESSEQGYTKALTWAKRRVVTANGGTFKQYAAV